MQAQAHELARRFPVRKGRARKTEFIEWLADTLRQAGYDLKIEKGSLGCRNLVVGDVEQAAVIFTAHYDTPAVLPFPNLITPKSLIGILLYQIIIAASVVAIMMGAMIGLTLLTQHFLLAYCLTLLLMIFMIFQMLAGRANRSNANDNTSGVVTLLEIALRLPAARRAQAAFVLFDLEEAGLIGSGSFRKAHQKAVKSKPVVNFDCVGDGDSLHFCMTRGAKKRPALAEKLGAAFQPDADKAVTVERGFFFYPSDQISFPVGVGVCALRKTKCGLLYLGRLHTRWDTRLDTRNVDLLADGAVRLVEAAGHAEL